MLDPLQLGPVDYFATAARYTDLTTVKERLRIPAGNATYDNRITAAILTAEVGIDIEIGGSFPMVGTADIKGSWLLSGLTVPPPATGSVRHNGDTDLYLSRTTMTGDEPEPSAQVDYDAANLVAAYVFQSAGKYVRLGLSSVTEHATYWHFATAAVAGDWADLVPSATVGVWLISAEPAVGSVPAPVSDAATSIATAVYKKGDAPTGSAGGDSFIGTLDVSDLVRSEMSRNPSLRGFHRSSFGVA